MNVGLVLSGGIGVRLGSKTPKQYQLLAGKPVLVHTIEQFQYCREIDFIVVVAAQAWKAQILQWKETYQLTKVKIIAPAGKDRQRSIRNGLIVAQELMRGEQDGVVIQDAARPLTSIKLITQLIQGLKEALCVMPALPVTDTTYISQDGQWVDGLLDRSTLYAGQAPEAFLYHPYLKLYQETSIEQLCTMSGSCQLPYSKGWSVKLIPGEQSNLKITYPQDIEQCEKLLRERDMTQ